MIDVNPPSSRDVHDLLRPLRRVLAALMRSEALTHGDVAAAVQQMTEVAARVLRVARTSVWVMAEDRSRIDCVNLYEAAFDRHSRGVTISRTDAPEYFAAISGARSIAAHDARTDRRTSEFTERYLVPNGITSMLDAPVLLRGELYGVVCHEHIGLPRHWDFWEELVAGTLADFVAMVLGASEHAQQTSELAAYRTHLEELVAARTEELRHAELHLRTIFEAAPIALILSRGGDGTVISANPKAEELFEQPIASLAGRTTLDFWVDLEERDKLLTLARAAGQVQDFVARMKGSSGRVFWAELSLRLLEVAREPCYLVGIRDVTEHRRAEERLRELATTDALTGALNRRQFFETSETEFARSHRYAHPLTLAMIDVDHFKRLNDEHGHAVGDEALRTLARVARKELRAADVFARIGGEEFAVLFPETNLEAANVVAERLRAAVAAAVIEVPAGAATNLTISVGLAARTEGEALEATLRRADAAMYAAKSSGRDRIVSAD